MIRVPDLELSEAAAKQLNDWQDEIDRIPSYEARVAVAKSQFSYRNQIGNPTFDEAKALLHAMCCGRQRCIYCEDSDSDEVEHMWPKNLYPEKVFAWENYLYSCGPCNGPKSSKFKVFSDLDGSVVDVTRARGGATVPPLGGRPLLINPRVENPLDFMKLNVGDAGTFLYEEHGDTQQRQRAAFTIEVLRLNARDQLVGARADAYEGYYTALESYCAKKQHQAGADALDRCKQVIQRGSHVTVWKEMQRQQGDIEELAELFSIAPEALGW